MGLLQGSGGELRKKRPMVEAVACPSNSTLKIPCTQRYVSAVMGRVREKCDLGETVVGRKRREEKHEPQPIICGKLVSLVHFLKRVSASQRDVSLPGRATSAGGALCWWLSEFQHCAFMLNAQGCLLPCPQGCLLPCPRVVAGQVAQLFWCARF